MTSGITPPPTGSIRGWASGTGNAFATNPDQPPHAPAARAERTSWPASVTLFVVLTAVRTCLHGLGALSCLLLGTWFWSVLTGLGVDGTSSATDVPMFLFGVGAVLGVVVIAVATLAALFVRRGRIGFLIALTVLVTLGGIVNFISALIFAAGGSLLQSLPSWGLLAVDAALITAGGRASTLRWAAAVRQALAAPDNRFAPLHPASIQDRVGHRPT